MTKIISYLTPIYEPASGGGARYLSMLIDGFMEHAICDQIRVMTERFPGTPCTQNLMGDKVEILRLYPFRAGRSKRDAWSYLAYLIQQIKILCIANNLPRDGIFIIHGSFFNNPNMISISLHMVRSLRPNLRIVLDLRDPKFPDSLIKKMPLFDAVISCSKNISSRLHRIPNLWDIPIMIEERRVDFLPEDELIRRYSLSPRSYIFNGSGFSHGKGTEDLVELTRALRSKGKHLILAVAGKQRFWTADMQKALDEGWLKPLGVIPSADVQSLGAAAWLDVNLSSVDSFPRHSLEVLMRGGRVLLPSGVPEFYTTCPDYVARLNEGYETLAAQACAIAEGRLGECGYPWWNHFVDNVIPQYKDLIDSLYANERGGVTTESVR